MSAMPLQFNEESFETYLDYIVRQMPGFVAWKTINSVYASANQLCAKFAGYNSVDSYVGTSDYDWKCDAVEFADKIKEQDELILKSGEQWNSLNILKFSGGVTYYFSHKSVLRSPAGRVLGILFVGTVLTDIGLIKMLNLLSQNDLCQSNKKVQCSIYPVVSEKNPGVMNLTERQAECLFYLLRGKTCKDIGRILNMSPRTAESHVEDLKRKFNCYSKSQLIEKGIAMGYFNQLPKSLLNKSGIIEVV